MHFLKYHLVFHKSLLRPETHEKCTMITIELRLVGMLRGKNTKTPSSNMSFN